jgi:DNA modification methylase
MTNTIYNEDCLQTNDRGLEYHYVITSPPDFDELGDNEITDDVVETYKEFLKDRLAGLNPINGRVTIFVSDRKANLTILQKHVWIKDIMEELGWNFQTQKIWVKTEEIDQIRLGYTFILTFNNKPTGGHAHISDIFVDKFKPSTKEYTYNFSKLVVKQFIQRYTKEGEIVYDPFIGSGTTAVACLELDRKYYGTEIDEDTFKLAQQRIEQTNTLNKFL